eukprot:jgi/Mesvir1/3223/Mv16372-RA.1
MAPVIWALLVTMLAHFPNAWASQEIQSRSNPFTMAAGFDMGRGGRKEKFWPGGVTETATAAINGDMVGNRAAQPSDVPTGNSLSNATRDGAFRNRRLLAGDAPAAPAMCAHAMVTAYAEPNYGGPMVSFGCSSSDLSLMLCFPLASLALKPGVTVALYSQVGFTGSMLVLQGSEPNLYAEYPRKYAFARSMAICGAQVEDPIRDCPSEGATTLRICPEESPVGPRGEVNSITTTHPDGEHFRVTTDGRFVLKYMRPRQLFWQTPGPEACFYKTYVREAQMGCLPTEHSAFQAIANEYIPHYYGAVQNFVYGGGEWIVLENVAHGIVHASVMDLDPGFGKCTRCGVDIRRYKTYVPAKGDYKLVGHEDINKRHASTSNKRKLIMHEVGEFLFNGGTPSSRGDIAKQLMPKLERLHQLLTANRLVSLVDASLLVLYGEQGAKSKESKEPSVVSRAFPSGGVTARVHLVDFGNIMHHDFSKAMVRVVLRTRENDTPSP